MALYRADQIDEAIETLNRSLASQAPDQQPFDLFIFSTCYAHRQDQATARRYYDQAEELVRDHQTRMPAKWRTELAQFAEESRFLLRRQSAD